MARKPTEIVKLQVRLPESLRRRLEKLAAHNNRSMNSEIITLLTEAADREERTMEHERVMKADEPPSPMSPWYREWHLERLDPKTPPQDPELRAIWEERNERYARFEREALRKERLEQRRKRSEDKRP